MLYILGYAVSMWHTVMCIKELSLWGNTLLDAPLKKTSLKVTGFYSFLLFLLFLEKRF